MIREHMNPNERGWDVCITSYEMAILNESTLKKFNWNHIIVDEAHRLKNEASTLSQVTKRVGG
jgi:SWI/SNF-related matrix-associated actin-dependent regulator of chromatin subfamily A member 5